MTISTYFESVKAFLLAEPIIASFQIVRERQTLVDGHLRVCLVLTDASLLEFSEYAHRLSDDEISVVTYSYHWADSQGDLLRRWDNAPHFPDLAGFPHHIHEGETDRVYPGAPMNIFTVIEQIKLIID